MKICFATYVSDNMFDLYGTKKLINSLKYFHPDIPHVILSSKHINMVVQKDPSLRWGTLLPSVISLIVNDYDLIIYIDADSVVLAPLTEALELDYDVYDVAGVRNNNDFHRAGKEPHAAVYGGISPDKYMNAGFIATKNKEFWKEWVLKNKNVFHNRQYTFVEQDVYNEMCHLQDKYKLRILDDITDTNIHYGISCLYGTNTHWDSLSDVELIDDKFMLNNKQIKVIHHAGGTPAFNAPKLPFEQWFAGKENVLTYVNEITGDK